METKHSCVVSAAFEPIGSPSTADKLVRLNEIMLYKTVSVEERREGHFIPLSRDWWYEQFGMAYRAVQEIAIKSGMLEANVNTRGTKRYCTDGSKAPVAGRSYCASYRLSAAFRDGHHKLIELSRKPRAKPVDANLSPVGKHLAGLLSHLSIDPAAATNTWDAIAASFFRRGLHRPKECQFGRFHSALTGVSSSVRNTLQVRYSDVNKNTHMNSRTRSTTENRKSFSPLLPSSPCFGSFVGIDVSNCQPLCLAIECLKQLTNQDVLHWLSRAQAGMIYEEIQDWLSLGHIGPRRFKVDHGWAETDPAKWTREQVKKQFMVATFGNDPTAPVWIAIEHLWPTVAKIMASIKKVRYENLAWTCQRIESSIMIQDAAVEIMRSHPQIVFGTVHDCIYLPEHYQDVAVSAITNAFQRHGVTPTVNITKNNPGCLLRQ